MLNSRDHPSITPRFCDQLNALISKYNTLEDLTDFDRLVLNRCVVIINHHTKTLKANEQFQKEIIAKVTRLENLFREFLEQDLRALETVNNTEEFDFDEQIETVSRLLKALTLSN